MNINIVNGNRGMNTMRVNGKTYTVPNGGSINVVNGEVRVNGVKVYPDGENPSPNTPAPLPFILSIKVDSDGVLGNITTDRDITVTGDVGGSVSAGGDVNCGKIGTNVSAGGDVECADVGGNLSAGGDVRCGKVGGSAVAGGDMTTRR